jgi:hypothetical protein
MTHRMLGGERLAHRDASYVLAIFARRGQARRFGPRTADGRRADRVCLRRLEQGLII